MSTLVISLTIILIAIRSVLMKAASDRGTGLPQMLIIFTTAGITSAVVSCVRGFRIHQSTLVIAMLFGVCNFMSQYLNIRAMGIGSASHVMFVVSCNFLISTLYSIFVFGETITSFRVLGIVLTCAAQVAFCLKGEGHQREGDAWLRWALAAMFFSGVVGVVQKYMQRSAHPTELAEMSMVAALSSTSIAALLLCVKGQWKGVIHLMTKHRMLTFTLALGCVATLLNVVSTYAHGLVDGSLAFPVFNGGSLVLSILSAHLLFRDRLSLRETLSISLGIAAIAVIGL